MDFYVTHCLLLIVVILVRDAVTSTLSVTVPPLVETKLGSDIKIPCDWRLADGEHLDQLKITLTWYCVKDQKPATRLCYRQGPIKLFENRHILSFDVDKDFTLIIKSVRFDDEMKFTCKVSSGKFGISEATSQVKVFAEPEFEHEVSDQVVDLTQLEANDSVEIGTCVLKNGHPKPSSVIWYKSEIPILHENITETVTEDSGKWTVRSTLRYRPRIHDHGSQFFCRASYQIPGESISMMSSKATLTLMYPPANVFMTVEPQRGNVQEDGNATLTCNTNANPPPSYTFYKMPDTNKPITKGVNGSRLHLAGITRSQSGKYRCQVTWRDRTMTNLEPGTASITVSYQPVVTLKNESTVMNGWTRFSCTAVGHPRPTIEWNPSKETTTAKVINETTVMDTIVISESAESTGVTACIARNSMGTAKGLIFQKQSVDRLSWLKDMWKEASAIAGGALIVLVASIVIAVVCCKKCSRKKSSEVASTMREVKPESSNGKEAAGNGVAVNIPQDHVH